MYLNNGVGFFNNIWNATQPLELFIKSYALVNKITYKLTSSWID